jgi:DNA-binding MarR family transcriptional regulator
MRNFWKAGQRGGEAAQLERWLLAIGRARGLRDPLAAEGERFGLTAPQVHALMWLGHDGPLTMGELARRCGITEKTITGIVDRLERAGFACRERDRQDRRLVHACLTAPGAEAFQRMHTAILGELRSVVALLEPDDLQALFRILKRLHGRLSEERLQAVRGVGREGFPRGPCAKTETT